jgi:hypothetical protein
MTIHRRRTYSRWARIMRRRLALQFAPKVSDFELDDLRPLASGVNVSVQPISSARAVVTAGRLTGK